MDVTIQTATEEARSLCAVLNLNLTLYGWRCSHKFIVSDRIAKHSVILGYDFIFKYKVNVTNPEESFNKLWIDAEERTLNLSSFHCQLKLLNLSRSFGESKDVYKKAVRIGGLSVT